MHRTCGWLIGAALVTLGGSVTLLVPADARANAQTSTGVNATTGSTVGCGPVGGIASNIETGATFASASSERHFATGESLGNSFAEASLASGLLRAQATSLVAVACGSATAGVSANARISDTLHFFIPDALKSAPVFVEMSMRIQGTQSADDPFGLARLQATGLHTVVDDAALDSAIEDVALIIQIEIWNGFVSPAGVAITALLDLGGGILLPDGSRTHVMTGGAWADYSHTAILDLSLPDGVTFTSDSGVFLTEPPREAVPEPATLALFVLSLAGLRLIGLRRAEM